MGKRWVKQRRADRYYKRAKAEGYRSRAAYKLLELRGRFGVPRVGDVVIDLGAAPGGWTQVAMETVGPGGFVLAVDRGGFRPLAGATFLRADVADEETVELIAMALGGRAADVVFSDMSPRLSGNAPYDEARAMDLARAALAVSERVLRPGGDLIVKLFQGPELDRFQGDLRRRFRSVRVYFPKASPKGSREVYVVAGSFRGMAEPSA